MRALNPGEPQVISFSAVLQRRGQGQPITRAYPVTRPPLPSAAAYERGFREGLRVRRYALALLVTVSAAAGLLAGALLL